MTQGMRQKIREIGTDLSPEMFRTTGELCAPLAVRADPSLCRIVRDVAYGPHERHRLDLFIPHDAAPGLPALIFVHGGGFIGGDKGAPEAPFYSNIGAWAASCGMIGVTINYRLAPDHPWPVGAEDLALAVAWLVANGAVPDVPVTKVVVMGQSAGAAHVASLVAMPHLHPAGGALAGAVMLSGLYDLPSLARSPFEHAYFGEDHAKLAERSSLPGLLRSTIPLLFAVSQYDPDTFQQQAALLVERWWHIKRRWPRILYLPDQNHLSPALRLGEPGDFLAREVLAFAQQAASLDHH